MTQDLRLALRGIVRAPSYAAMVIGSLAIGIAAPVLAFSVINAVFLERDDDVDDEGLVRVTLTAQDGGWWSLGSTYDLYASLRRDLEDLAAITGSIPVDVAFAHGGNESVVMNGELVAGNYFPTLGVQPAAGRFFSAADESSPLDAPVVVISYQVWRRQFQLRPDVIGSHVLVNGTPLQIVGVAPERFDGVWDSEDPTRVWIPLGLSNLALRLDGRAVSVQNAGRVRFGYVARLQRGVVSARLESATAALVYRAGDGTTQDGTADGAGPPLIASERGAPGGARVTTFWRGDNAPDPLEMTALFAGFMALPFLVLAIACINAGNVVLARATRLTSMWTVQLALGARPGRLVRQPLGEALLLALPGAALGLLFTRWGLVTIETILPFEPQIDWSVVVFAFATAVATPLLFGLGPVWAVITRIRTAPPGRPSQVSPRSRVRTALLVVQTALSLALLGTGIQWVRTVLDGFGDGFGRGDRMLVATLDVDKLAFDHEAADRYYSTLLDRVRAVPGAARAALTGGIQFTEGVPPLGQTRVWLPGDAPDRPRGSLIAYVTADALAAINTPLIAGRQFTSQEHAGPLRSVIVNEPFVTRFMSGNPLGQTIRLRAREPVRQPLMYEDGLDATIVGVVRAAQGRRNDSTPTVYAPVPIVHLAARTLYIPFDDAATLAAAVPAVRNALRSVDPRVPFTLATLDDFRWQRSQPRRFMAVAVAALGGLALVLAAIGLYGAMSYIVELRTREIGVRMALGATPRMVLRRVLSDSARIALLGCAIGTAGAGATAIVVRSSMYGASTIDPLAFGTTATLLVVIMLLASALPARRAALVDPAMSLRAE